MQPPLISVILPVYNGKNYVRDAIESVLNQSFRDLELIVVDDGSIDSTPSIAQAYGTRLRYVYQENRGVGVAFNHGIRLAAGKYISWISHDDKFAERKLEMQLNASSLAAGPIVCYTDVQGIDEDGKALWDLQIPQYPPGVVLRHILTACSIASAAYSLMFDRRCIDEVGIYNESLRYTQDADMLVRLARQFPLIRVPEVLMHVRQHSESGIRVHYEQWGREAVRFYQGWLDRLALEELFPDMKSGAPGLERGKAYQWLADTLAVRPRPVCWVALSQYWRAMLASPALIRQIAPKYFALFVDMLRSRSRSDLGKAKRAH